MNFDCTKSMI